MIKMMNKKIKMKINQQKIKYQMKHKIVRNQKKANKSENSYKN